MLFGIILSVAEESLINMKTTVGLVAGIAVGVCIGLLIAPDKGSETRKKLADSAGDWMEKLKGFFSAGEEEDTSSPRSKSYKQTPRTTT
jgi:Gas vesicle protein